MLLGYMESQNIAFSFDVFNDHSVVSGLTVDTRYYEVYLVSAATPDAAGGSWGVTFTETGTKFDNKIEHSVMIFTHVYNKQMWISNYTPQCSVGFIAYPCPRYLFVALMSSYNHSVHTKMAAISQTTFSNACSWVQIVSFGFKVCSWGPN